MALYGRQDLVERLARSDAAVTVIAGDSGVGKSEVLAAVQARGAERGELVAPPLTLTRAPGALQRGLLQGLSELVAAAIREQGRAAQVVGHLRDAVNRLVETKGQELARVLGRELVVLARARLGDEFGNALADYASELKSSVDERLSARIEAATDQGVVGLVTDLAAEVCALASGTVSVALDRAERLDDADQRVLADLVDQLPPAFRLRAAFATYTGDQNARAERLRDAGAALHRVPGLNDAAVRLWLTAEGLDAELAPTVLAASAGYPLHIGDAIRHLKGGGSLSEALLNQQFAQRTSETWNDLDIEVASHARALAVFADPLDRPRMAPFLGLTAGQYGEVEERLWRARVFSVEVNGQRWFHEQRRRFILERLLSDEERAGASEQGAQELWAELRETDNTQLVGPLSDLVARAPNMRRDMPKLDLVVDLPRDELAIAAALLELTERETPAVEGDGLLRHARDTFGGEGDLVAAMRRLDEKDLVQLEEFQQAAFVAPTLGEALAVATLAGRAARELSRSPVPRVASLFFAEVDGHIPPFAFATYGIGAPSMVSLAGTAADARRTHGEASGADDRGVDLLLRGRIADRPVYGAIAFSNQQVRDEALRRLTDFSGEILGERYEVHDLLALPDRVVPSRRFLQAAGRLVGQSLGNAVGGPTPRFKLDEPLTPRDALDLRVRTISACRELMSSTERYATDLDRTIGFYVHAGDDDLVQVEVIGGPEGIHELNSDLGSLVGGPFWLTQLSEALALGPGELIRRMHMSSGHLQDQDPVVETLRGLQETAAEFNRHQNKYLVPLDAGALTHLLTQAARRAVADAKALARAVPIGGTEHSVEPRATYLLVPLDGPKPGIVPGGMTVGKVRYVPNPGGGEEVHVAVVSGETEGGITEGRTTFAEAFGFSDVDEHGRPVFNGAHADIRTLIAELLGHTERELAFVHPEEPALAV